MVDPKTQKRLVHSMEQEVKFSETDALGIVWHGNYIRYFEDGREAFGKKYGVGYLDFYNSGYSVPVVSVSCDYKRSLRFGDVVIIETTYLPCEAAKLKFEFRLYNKGNNELVATGSSLQVFLDRESADLQLINPVFFEHWKKKFGLI